MTSSLPPALYGASCVLDRHVGGLPGDPVYCECLVRRVGIGFPKDCEAEFSHVDLFL